MFAGGEEVVVIYNSRLPESKALAGYYALKRDVPKSQVFGFDLPVTEEMSRAEFQGALEHPLARKLAVEKLWRIGTAEVPGTNGKPTRVEGCVLESKIRYAVLCYGVPLRILHDPNLKESEEDAMRPELRRNGAAVDSELACLPQMERHFVITGPARNPAYTTTNTALLHPTNGVLIVARLDGPTPGIARGLVDKTLQAERDGLWGRAYFDLRNTTEPGMKQGDDWIRGAAEVCKHFGFETVVDENAAIFPASFPMSHIAFYAGWYITQADGAFGLPKVEFMTGAFAYHLHSFSAETLRNTNRAWVAPLLAKGATCTMGCVDEPYLAGTPDVGTFAARFCFFGMSFGEAATACQPVLSWQTTVVGDPLYRPFTKPPKQIHDDLEARHSPLVEWSHVRIINLNLVRGAPPAQMSNYLEEQEATKHSAVLSEKLADLYAAQGKPSSAALLYQQALKLDPTPQQRLRLRLSLGDKLMALDRNEDALANYQKLIQEAHDRFDKLPTYRKLLTLAQKLGKTEDAAKYEEQIKLMTGSPPPPAK